MTQTLVPAPPRPSLASHRNREPKVKTLSLPVSSDASNFTETKRRLAERAGTLQPAKTVAAAPTMTQTASKRGGLVGLSFKKNKSTSDAVAQLSPTSPTLDPKSSSHDLVASARDSGWSSRTTADTGWGEAASGWGSIGGWGDNSRPSSPSWGAQQASPQDGAPGSTWPPESSTSS